MSEFYAFLPDKNGKEPNGTDNRTTFKLKTCKGAIKRAKRVLGEGCVVYRFTNIFDYKTYVLVPGSAFCVLSA